MKTAVKRLRPPFKCHGGKFYLCQWVVDQFPGNCRTYLEPFGGAGSVLLNKKISDKEIYNDLHQPTANIFHCLVNNTNAVIQRISDIEYSEKSFKDAKSVEFQFGSIDSAVAELVLRRMSRGGMKKHFSWSTRTRGGRPGDLNAWETFKDLLPLICKRLQKVEVHHENALDLIKEHLNDDETLVYIDPPYVHSTRTAKDVYDCEMKDEEHRKLADLLRNAEGYVVISGYDSPLYRELYADWKWLYKEMPNNSGQGKTKQRRVECLIMNY